jgi:diaminopropionate ammonia-lyase
MRVFLNPNPLNISSQYPVNTKDVVAFHKMLPGYEETPLVSLDDLAYKLGIRRVYVKDEGHRFGLKSFKVLGVSYAVFNLLREKSGGVLKPEEFLAARGRELASGLTFTCATDGNHGRALAWIARLLGRPAKIFMPEYTVPARIEAIESEGAEVVVVEGGYNVAVGHASREGKKKNRMVIADAGYPGYMEVPWFIQEGYMTMFWEIQRQLEENNDPLPNFIFLQAGVGAFAAAAALFFSNPSEGPHLICVEPTAADCLFHSAEEGDGQPKTVTRREHTIMAGLNCETPSYTAWPIIRDRFDVFVNIEDYYARQAMRVLARHGIVAGESGAAGVAALIALFIEKQEYMRMKFDMSRNISVLLINTESDTDPEGYEQIVGLKSSEVGI